MTSQDLMAKYDSLRDWLNTVNTGESTTLSFDEIDEIVGGLPASARRHRAWWANDFTHVQALAWIEAGRVVDEADLDGQWVRFTSRHLGGEFDDFWKPLRREIVPRRGAPWYEVWEFALTFDGYAYAGKSRTLGEEANVVAAVWHARSDLPSSLDDLRSCLFFEQRRYHHFGEDPDGESAE